ncbi:MAG: M28 family peptidase [Verrucomicrobiales bacterium]|nr:M28 family peptidase [Verrucomicrobiales bacterium]
MQTRFAAAVAAIFSVLFILGLAVSQDKKPPAKAKANPHANPHADPHATLEKPDPEKEKLLLSGTRQLTFEGKRAGEGYFSADGKKLIFQSEREPGNPFYQIYLLDLETGDTERVSPGHGKTTCAWIHPDGKKVMFASTHDDAEAKAKQKEEIEIRESGKARKYSWDYDENFEVYEYDLETEKYTNLTNAKGYDAEGAYSPDGSKIVFASNRQAYDEENPMSEEDQKFFKLDKKFAMEIYIADADGSNVKRLTNADGYDGGPFFSSDGKKICWRRFDRKGMTAEIFTMNIDGTEQKQLTKIGAMSWAPMFHPTGEYLIFATNKHGFANFELYLVRANGNGEPVRVTHTEGFDGLPAFSPDGKTLAWTSNRTSAKTSQIFISKWDHDAARRMLGLDKSSPQTAAPITKADSKTGPEIAVADLKQHIEYLASDELEGRLTGTKGGELATNYMADNFQKIGLEPAGTDGFFFPFEFTAGVDIGEDNALDLTLGGEKIETELNKDWRPISFSKLGKIAEQGIVFAGYGMELKNPEGGSEYSSYFHLDVKGKWVMVLRYQPNLEDKKERRKYERFAPLRHKATMAQRKFAAGIIFVTGPNNNPDAKGANRLVPMRYDASSSNGGIPAISISTEMAAKLIASAGKDLQKIQDELDTGAMVAGFPIPDAKLAAKLDVEQEKRTGRNVLARLKSDDPEASKNPVVMIGAHIDHIGPKAGPGSRAKNDEKNQIHNGADDNASGSAGLLEIAEYLADQKKLGKLKLNRDIVFAAWSGEELGLLGSNRYVQHVAKTTKKNANAPIGDQVAAYLNMDMIGRLDEKLIMQGLGSSDYWAGAIERRNAPIGLSITTQKDSYLPTDTTAFYPRKVPILAAFTGLHDEYHTPRDTPDLINYEGAKDVSRLMALILRDLVTTDSPPVWAKVDPPKRGSRGFSVFLGTIPDYAQGDDVKGVKLSGVSENGPAQKAGLQAGDIIIELNGVKIGNVYDYTGALADLKVGKEFDIKILRDGKEVPLKITPASRN